ncbi:MAG: hypothetical protein OEL55_01345, partial [Desulfobulbaceae bacterium]|nr:hypothetical protein [Desulfobulbaceae bacterium]
MENRLPTLKYNEFISVLDQGEVAEIHLHGEKEVVVTDTFGRRFSLFLPNAATIVPELVKKGIPVVAESETSPLIINFLSVTLPLVLLLIFGFYVHRKMAAADSKETDFAKHKSSATGITGRRRVTFRDVAGVPEVKEELLEV